MHGEKAAPARSEDEQVDWHRAERSYGRFERAIRIPVDIDADAAKAQYKDGVLHITMPKTPAAQSREIPVEAAAS